MHVFLGRRNARKYMHTFIATYDICWLFIGIFSCLYALISIASFQLRTEPKPRSIWKVANRVHLCFIDSLFSVPTKILSNEFYALLINSEKVSNFSSSCTEKCAFKCMVSSNLDSVDVSLHRFYSSISTPIPTLISILFGVFVMKRINQKIVVIFKREL